MEILKIKNLKVSAGGKKILRGVSLGIKPGEVHVLMGPNGSGKSTLAAAIMGQPRFKITDGSIFLSGRRINRLSPDQRAKLGLFMSFQYPVEVAGLSVEHFLRAAYNNLHPDKKMSPVVFRQFLLKQAGALDFSPRFFERSLNHGFSGGEKKKLEMLQLAVLKPRLAILDEIDSGLDIDALKAVARVINRIKTDQMSILVITHYYRILKYLKPDKVQVMIAGRMVKSGKRELATRIEKKGYDWLSTKSQISNPKQ